MSVLLDVREITKSFKLKGHWYHKRKFTALSPLSFAIETKKNIGYCW